MSRPQLNEKEDPESKGGVRSTPPLLSGLFVDQTYSINRKKQEIYHYSPSHINATISA
jgi:hypothetical protein